MKKIQLSYLFFIFSITVGFAQCPVVSFDYSSSVCLGETLYFDNIESDAADLSWDFCAGDILNGVTGEELVTLTTLSNLRGIVTEYETGAGLIGFAIGENNKLVRIRFGETIDPDHVQVEEMTTVSSFLNVPRGIAKVVEGGQKYLLIANSGNGSLVRVSFGTTYTATSPARATIAGPVGLSGLRGLSAYRQGSRLIAFVSGIGVGNSQVGVLNFPTGITSAPVHSTINIPGAGGLNQVQVLNDCGQWVGLVSSFTQDRVYKLFFGNDLRTLENSQVVDGIPGALTSEIRMENGHYYGVVSTASGSFWRLSFGEDFGAEDQTQLEDLTNLGVLSNTTGLSIYERNSETVALAVGFSDKKLSALRFEDACGATVPTTKSANPSGLEYTQPGLKTISLTGTDANGNVRRVTRQLTVQNSQAPQIDFSVGTGNCANSAINFTSSISSGSVSGYQWFFDGVEGATTANASFTFASAGEHTIRLVGNDDACTNTVEKKVTIYEEITPTTFSLVGSLCTNNQVAVSNPTDDASYPEGMVQYRWFLDGSQISTTKAPSLTFPSPGAHTLRVVRSIPGCSAETIEDLVIDDGPVVTMDYSNSCWDAEAMEANVHFTTSITGDNYTYIWDFGDNTTAEVPTPMHSYNTAGEYNVRVTVQDEITGCSISTPPQVMSIMSDPLIDFEHTSAYEDVPVQFVGKDNTPEGDAVNTWSWNFGEMGGSNEQNTNFTFDNKDTYVVALEATTVRGCFVTANKEVEVTEYPCAYADFELPLTVCRGESVSIINRSQNAVSYDWDFCSGDIENDYQVKELGTLSVLNNLREIVVIEEEFEEELVGFAIGENDKMVRIRFGSDPGITSFTIEEINVTPFLKAPRGLTKVIEGAKKYLLIGNSGDGSIVRLDFGESYYSQPNASLVGGLEGLSNLRGLNTYWQDGRLVGFVVGTGAGNSGISVLDFGNSVTNQPVQTPLTVPGASFLNQIRVLNTCGNWYGITTSFSQNRIYKLDFGEDLRTLKSSKFVSIFGGPLIADIVYESEKYYALVGTNTAAFLRAQFGADFMTDEPPVIDNFDSKFPGFSLTTGLASYRKNSNLSYFLTTYSSKKLIKIGFEGNCSASFGASSETTPEELFFEAAGKYKIQLQATSNRGYDSYLTKTITVTDLAAAPIDFELDESRCIGNNNQFNFIGDASIITSYSWDFDGDGVEDSNEPNPAWQFPAAGEYEVTLTVGNDNGCTNSAKKTIPIYNVPSPVFEYEATAVMCSHQAIQFNDLTEGLPEDEQQITYLWDFNGEGISTEKNPTYAFETAGQKTVTLTIGIPGCEGTSSQNLTLVAGSKVAFNMGNQCEDVETRFENLTTGDGITGYQWEFGNGYTSTQASPSVVFEAAGDYDVKLTATNQLGCENILTKKVSQRGVPKVDFTHDLACSGTTVQFTDKSTVPLANVAQWSWDFGGLGTSTAKNPHFVFPSAGEYNVTLTATSNYGCSATLVKKITVVEGATASFTANSNCVGLPVTFTDQSTSAAPITSRFWTINGKSYTTADVSEVFTTAGEYEVTLEVTNSNLCTSSLTKTFEVYRLPQASFDFNSSCTNEQIEFVAVADEQVEVVSRVWDFAGQAPANGARAYHQFKQAGDYTVSLEVESADGCRSATTKTVSVNLAPTAALSHTSPYGQLPVSVQFTDVSTGSTDRLWFLGDGLEPVSDEPVFSHTFEQEGNYLISLLSLAGNGCSDTLATVVKAAPPKLDLQLKALNYTESNGVLKFVPTIVNHGTMDVSGFTILINIDDKVTASEVYEGTLEAGQTLSPSLAFELVRGQSGVEKICLELVPPSIDSETEFSPLDNYNCLSLSGAFQTGIPYPNPVEERITVDVILPADGEVEIALLDLSGQPVTTEKHANLKAGLTTFTYEVAHYKPGLYLLRIRSGGIETIQRIVKR